MRLSTAKCHRLQASLLEDLAANPESERLWLTGTQETGRVLALRSSIVIGEGVSLTVRLKLVYDARVVVGACLLIIGGRVWLGLVVAIVFLVSGADKSSTDTSSYSLAQGTGWGQGLSKGSSVAAKDVSSCGLGEATPALIALENIALDVAGNSSFSSLTVDSEVAGAVSLPDIVNVLVKVVAEHCGILGFPDVGRNNSKSLVFASLINQRLTCNMINVLHRLNLSANILQATKTESTNGLVGLVL